MLVVYPVDLSLFDRVAHNPSYFSLMRSMQESAKDVLDFCVPCNPYFPTDAMFAEYAASLPRMLKHYPSDNETIATRLCETLGLDPAFMVLANGSTELITWLDQLFVRDSLATPVPTFGRWTDQSAENGKRVDAFQLLASDRFGLCLESFERFIRQQRSRAAVICNPNNPDGGYVRRADLLSWIDRMSDLDLIVVDESFTDFVDLEENASIADDIVGRDNVVVLKSLGKNFGLHGVRFGYAVSNRTLAARLRKALPKWNINSLAEAIIFSLRDNMDAYRDSLYKIKMDRHYMMTQLRNLPCVEVLPSQGNFLMMHLLSGVDGASCRDELLAHHGLFIRECGNKAGIDSSYIRAAVRGSGDVDRLVESLARFLIAREPTVLIRGCDVA